MLLLHWFVLNELGRQRPNYDARELSRHAALRQVDPKASLGTVLCSMDSYDCLQNLLLHRPRKLGCARAGAYPKAICCCSCTVSPKFICDGMLGAEFVGVKVNRFCKR